MGPGEGEDVLRDGDDLGADAVAGEEGDAIAPPRRLRGGVAAEGSRPRRRSESPGS